MGKTTVKVSDPTNEKLKIIKKIEGANSMDEVIIGMISRQYPRLASTNNVNQIFDKLFGGR